MCERDLTHRIRQILCLIFSVLCKRDSSLLSLDSSLPQIFFIYCTKGNIYTQRHIQRAYRYSMCVREQRIRKYDHAETDETANCFTSFLDTILHFLWYTQYLLRSSQCMVHVRYSNVWFFSYFFASKARKRRRASGWASDKRRVFDSLYLWKSNRNHVKTHTRIQPHLSKVRSCTHISIHLLRLTFGAVHFPRL